MTKEKMEEKIICLLGYCSENVINSINDIFEEFTRTNVCIPKGENCHPYHMELHQWAENPLVDLQVFNDTNGAFTLSIMDEYRIKPSEPVYEWQWALVLNTIGEIGRTIYMTKEEFQRDIPLEQSIYLEIDEETKRVRS